MWDERMKTIAGTLQVGDFFTPEGHPDKTTFIMRVPATALNDGLCESLKDKSLASIRHERDVIRVDKYDQHRPTFYV
jgi:hypothetical protein